MTVIVRRLTALVVVVTLLACEKKREEAPTPSAEDRAVEAAMARLAIPAGDRVQMAVWLVGAKEAGIARESRTGTCIVVAKSADGSWRAHAAFKGTPGAGDLKPPLTTAGTMQEGITLHDLELLAGLHCKA